MIPSMQRSLGKEDVGLINEELHEMEVVRSLLPAESEAWGELQLYLEDLWQRLGEDKGQELFQHLAEASHLVDEANDITSELRPEDRLKFEVELVWDIHRDVQDIIVIRLMRFGENEPAASVVSYW